MNPRYDSRTTKSDVLSRSVHTPSSHKQTLEVKSQSVERQLLKQLGKSQPAVRIENTCEVASYSWLDSTNPKIALPGRVLSFLFLVKAEGRDHELTCYGGLPPRWTPPRSKPLLSQDSGKYFRDQNAARYSKHPLEPAVRAVLAEGTPSLGDEIRVFACGSTLGNLLRFVREQAKPFRLRVEMVGKTAFFIRKENSPTQLIEDVYGYGHTFPEAYTTWDPSVKESESHQKIIRYSFGGKEMLVRFEADGYLPQKLGFKPTAYKSPPESVPDLDSLLEQLRTKPLSAATHGSLEITSGGYAMPQAAIFDLKTRSAKKAGLDVLGEELPRLWINQIPNFILAFHQRGKFHDIRIQEVGHRVHDWESSHQAELRMFSALLDHICAAVEKAEDSRLEVVYTVERGLQLQSAGSEWAVMPTNLIEEWTSA